MKTIIIAVFLYFCFYLNAQTEKKNAFFNKYTYATYCAGYTILNKDYVDKMNFSNFDFYYLMASPKVEAKDLDISLDKIIQKYVIKFNYPQREKGIGLTERFIDSVHCAGGKVLLSMKSNDFIDLVKTEVRRNNLSAMLSAFIKKYNYDGFDLDWEKTLDINLHYLLLKNLRDDLNLNSEKKYYITTALFTSLTYPKKMADSLSEVVDWINLMTYDLGGGTWKIQPSYNTPMRKIEDLLINWNVFSPNKLCIGLAAYGFKYMNLKPGERISRFAKISDYSSYISYSAVVDSLRSGWKEVWNEQEHVPYYFSSDGKSFITSDNPRSIQYKLNWIVKKGYRGVFWWELYHDFVLENPNDKYGKFLLKDKAFEFLINNSEIKSSGVSGDILK